MGEQKKSEKLQINVRAKSPVIVSSMSKMTVLDCDVMSTQNINDTNGNFEIEQKIKNKHLNIRSKSPVIMSNRIKVDFCHHGIESISERNQESILLQNIETPNTYRLNTLKHMSLCSTLHSTPNTQSIKKSVLDSRTILNLSPIISKASVKTNSNNEDINCQQNFQHMRSLEQLNNQDLRIKSSYENVNKLKTNETLKGFTDKCTILDTPILQDITRKKNDYVNEKAKKCLFEKDVTNSISNFDNDQDSFNISLDILEQVCQMSEIMDNSSTVEVKINDDVDKNKTKLAFFLYGNNSSKFDDTKEEDEILQLALSMEDNLLAETKSKNKLYSEGEFSSLNQLKMNDYESPNINGSEQCNNVKLKNDFKNEFFGHEEIDYIGNTQMCEIADITEPLESFVDQWSQQYIRNDSNLCKRKKENNFLNDSLQLSRNSSKNACKSSVDLIDHKVFVKENNLCNDIKSKNLTKVKSFRDDLNESFSISVSKTTTNPIVSKSIFTADGNLTKVSDKTLKKVQSMLKDELNDASTVTKESTIPKSNLCKGFSTAGGKSIEVSDKALKKVQSMLKDDLDDTSTVTKETTIPKSNLYKGFLTAGGKSIEVSDKALKKVQSMLKDELNDASTVTKETTIPKSNLYKGFSTAGGKSIEVSDKALKKVQSMLKDDFDGTSTVTKETTIPKSNEYKGFSTAGGKSIEVSDKALKKVQSMLKDDFDNTSTVTKETTIPKSNLYKGFSTAGGKSIEVSDKALKKVQSMLEDELDDTSTVSKETIIPKSNLSKGFSTAVGKPIEVSKMSVKKVVSMLKNEVNELNVVPENITLKSNVCQELPTAGGLNSSTSNGKVISPKMKSFEMLKLEEDCILEDLSLIDTVEKIERELPNYNVLLRNKRPGSPAHVINNKIRKIVFDKDWENCVLKTSFDEYLAKKHNVHKVPLFEAVNRVLPKKCMLEKLPENGLKNNLIKLNVDNALHLKLFWEEDCRLYECSRNKIYNFQDVKNLFLSHHIVDANLISKGWIENHFRLIVWKLAATEISFPNHFHNKLLTAKNVTHQLLHRYYREIEKCQRSALKKVLEKDESATKRIILCVSRVIKSDSAETYTIELTDGWYCVQGLVDFEMNILLHKGIVKVGTKLMIYNAELIGAGEGIDPLSDHDDVKLKISSNSTRRVRWSTKLGFYKNAALPIPISLESVLPRGGSIGSLSLVILRKYPMMFFERKINSKSVFRNEKMETIEAEKYKAYQQKTLEIISNEIETELIAEMTSTTKKSKNCLLSMKKENLDKLSINDLSNILENSTDPLEIQSMLSQNTLESLQNFKKSEHDKFYNELRSRVDKAFHDKFKDARKVIPLFKLRVVDETNASTGFKPAILTIWNPSEEISCILNKSSEGQCCTFYNLTSSGFMNGELQLSGNKNTRFNFQGYKNEYAKRDVFTSFKSILSSSFLPLFGELDIVGIVVSGVNKINNLYNEIYVSDKEMNIVSILFRGDIKEHGCDEIMFAGSIILGINIHFRGLNKISTVPKLYSSEQSSFTTIPKTEHLVNIFTEYKIFMKKSENKDFLQHCQNKLGEVPNGNVEVNATNNAVLRAVSSNTLNTPTNVFHKSYSELPVSVVKTPSTPPLEFSPAQKRIKMLNSYGKTPPLNIIHTKPPDKKLLGQFKTPTRRS